MRAAEALVGVGHALVVAALGGFMLVYGSFFLTAPDYPPDNIAAFMVPVFIAGLAATPLALAAGVAWWTRDFGAASRRRRLLTVATCCSPIDRRSRSPFRPIPS